MRLYIIRHGDPDYPNNTITPTGHREAAALSEKMAKLGLDRIYTSPLGRARDTARYTADKLGMTPIVEEWTAELGLLELEQEPWGRLMAWDIPGEIIRAKSPYPSCDDWHCLPPFDKPVIRQEFERLKKDSDAFLARHGYERQGGRYCCVRPNREKIAVFCHGGFGLSWLSHLLEIPLPMVWSGFWMPPTSVTTVLFDERSKDWAVPRCIGLSDVSHLYAAGMTVTPHGLKANIE